MAKLFNVGDVVNRLGIQCNGKQYNMMSTLDYSSYLSTQASCFTKAGQLRLHLEQRSRLRIDLHCLTA